MTTTELPVLKAKDYASDQDIRWCPGCGDYAILNQMKKVLAELQAKKENTVFVSGIGCSSRFPYYMDTFGFHSIHGRAPAIATGVKIANPSLDVWMVTGDGDALSIGGNHLMHILRRNVGVKILLFNNRIYGLTKGQYSPTSETGKKTKSSPMGSIDAPLAPLSLALGAQASFVARAIDVDRGLPSVLEAAAAHKGTALVEIYQDCNIFNHKAFGYATDKDTKADSVIFLEHGKPMVYGKDNDKGLMLGPDHRIHKVKIGEDGISENDLLVHDADDEDMAYTLSHLRFPEYPEPMGVFYSVRDDTYEDLLVKQLDQARDQRGKPDLDKMFNSGDTYTIEDQDPQHTLHEGA